MTRTSTANICPLCELDDREDLGPLPALKTTRVRLCRACSVASLDPVPTDSELAAYYAGDYAREFGAARPDSPAFVEAKRRKALDRWRFLNERALTPTGSLLEVGCAEGEFLRLARENGVRCTGIEPDAALAAHARRAASCDVTAAMFPCPLRERCFDALATFHVIEHVAQPIEFLRNCVDLLRPGGLLYLATPDLDDTACNLSHPVFRPCHLSYFTWKSLEKAMLAAGCTSAEAVRTNVCGKPELKAFGRR